MFGVLKKRQPCPPHGIDIKNGIKTDHCCRIPYQEKWARGGPVFLLSSLISLGAQAEPPEARQTGAPAAQQASRPNEQASPESAPIPATEPEVESRAIVALLNKTAAESPDAPLGLRFEVIAFEPAQSWAMGFVNRGAQELELLLDPRLLKLSVEPPPEPGRKKAAKPVVCGLPERMLPERLDMRFVVTLAPGEGVVEAFDPRLYCLITPQGFPLVPGARVSARLALPKKLAENQGGAGKRRPTPWLLRVKETDVTAAPVPPFAAELAATPFLLLPSSFDAIAEPTASGPLELQTVSGTDAEDEYGTIVTLRLKNVSDAATWIYFRREFVTFEGVGPQGTFYCDSNPSPRAPDPLAFTQLKAGESFTFATRLVEVCPGHSFSVPGLYTVLARFRAQYSGEEWGISVFTGVLSSAVPALVRVQRGPVQDWIAPRRTSLKRIRVPDSTTKERVSETGAD